MQSHIFEQIYQFGVIPVIQIDNADRAVSAADSLAVGGLPIAEITLRTEAALDSIRNIAQDLPHILVGAGTVINRDHAEAACEAGAKFLVSPGLDEALIGWAQANHVPIIPGAVTPTEMMHAIRLGLTLLKFFPAKAMGGLETIRSVSEPFPQVRFIPTGGIRLEDLTEYLGINKIHAVGGSWMATRQMIQEARFDDIAHLAKAAHEVVKQARKYN
jgi:2-dehydro-3-deoxyphosphogluconate aldolase / (4S)-4-hydroxy-2-oxoglutarate aldolase